MISIELAYEFRPVRSPYQHGLNETPASMLGSAEFAIEQSRQGCAIAICQLAGQRFAIAAP
jgi:hypothetical protein